MASEIRVDKINSLSGVGTVTLSPTGVDIAGITTVATFKVGTGVTVSSDGDIFATGVTTSTTFSGNFSGGTVSGTTGTFTGAATLGNGSGLNFGDTGARIIGETGASGLLRFDTNGGEKVRIDASGRLLIGTGAIATPKSSGAGGLDLDNGSISLVVGGNENSTGRTDGTSKINRIAAPHRTNSEEPVAMLSCQASTSTNTLFYGGGSSYTNAVTEHKFYTAADATTTTGTQRLRIRSSGEIQVGVLDTPSASRGALGIKASSDAQSVPINLYLQESSGGEGYGIGVDGDGDLNFYNGGATSPTLEIKDDNDVVITDGDLVIGTAGHGIDFSAQTATSASGASTSTEVLDHYEEGTFTPYSPSLTVDYGTGHYIRIGSYVCASIRVKIPSNSNANTFVLDGLPFNCRSYSGTYHNGGYLMYSGGSSYGAAAGVLVYDNSDRLQMYTLGGGNIMLTNLDNIQVRIQVHYFV